VNPVLVFGLACLFGPFTLLIIAAALQHLYRRLRPLLAAAWYRLLRDPDVYPPEAAEAPKAACGCPYRPELIGCQMCGQERCFAHREHACDLVEVLYRLPAYIKEQSNG
jgi:hypothetical protein